MTSQQPADHQPADNLTLITGSAGKTGHRIADRLTRRGRPTVAPR